jgi:hypothetical protein
MSLPTPPRGAEHAAFYAEVVEALRRLERPGGPVRLWSCPSTALPSPARYPDCMVRVSDLDVLACSNGGAWIRQDTGAAI